MELITLEEHYTDQRVIDANNAFNGERPPLPPERARIMKFLMSKTFPGPELLDFKMRVAFMDANHIAVQVLSLTSPVSDYVPAPEALRICRLANDITFGHIKEYPGRFAGFATLPMADPKAAADELERCVRDLGFSGALLAGRFKGRFYNEAEFFPIFERAARLDVPIYFHPAFIPQEVQDLYYMSEAYSPAVGTEFASAGYGWHSEVGIQVVRLILSGLFDKLPGLKVICGHWGETMPAFLDRMDIILNQGLTGLKKKVSEYYKESVYITPSGIMSESQLDFIVRLMGADHVLYAVDYPYMKPENTYGFLMDSSLSEEEKELIGYKNARKLLHLDMELNHE